MRLYIVSNSILIETCCQSSDTESRDMFSPETIVTKCNSGCLQLLEILEISWNLKTLLEILEISWNLNGPPGNFCVMIEN